MKAIQVYECSHCFKYYKKSRKSVEKHQLRCFFNSDSRSCATCIYLFGWQESECIAGVKFTDGKLQTHCDKHMTQPEEIEETLHILENQGHIKIVQPWTQLPD